MINQNLIANNYIPKKIIKKDLNKKLNKSFEKILEKICIESVDENNFFNLFEKKFNFNFDKKELKKFCKFNTIVCIGMGGSILGTKAIFDFFEKKIKKKVFFFDNLDVDKNINFKKFHRGKKILFLLISKSGNTIETITNFFSLEILNQKSKNIIVITEKKNNILYSVAKKFNLYLIEHKNQIGGRYSVLSEVGIVPAFLMGINVLSLRKNLKKYLITKNKEKFFLKESSVNLANILSNGKINDLVFLNYEPKLSNFLLWCQQLIAESLGKKEKGFLPVISNAPKDHHSLLQLYLEGPKNKIFNIFSFKEKKKVKINTKKYTNKINFLHNKDVSIVKEEQKNALIQVFKSKKIPFREFTIKNLNEETLGELFSYFMLETIFVGKMLNLNPFDQPAVEEIKLVTKKLLK